MLGARLQAAIEEAQQQVFIHMSVQPEFVLVELEGDAINVARERLGAGGRNVVAQATAAVVPPKSIERGGGCSFGIGLPQVQGAVAIGACG